MKVNLNQDLYIFGCFLVVIHFEILPGGNGFNSSFDKVLKSELFFFFFFWESGMKEQNQVHLKKKKKIPVHF